MIFTTVTPRLSIAQLQRTRQMRERVAEACRLVESDRMIRGVHIVVKGVSATDELRQLQEYAARCHVSLTVDAHGMISIRPGAEEDQS